MADEHKPLTDMRMFRTVNGGWVIRTDHDDFGRSTSGGTYSYSSDKDMLEALPDLIGVEKIVMRTPGR